MPNLGQGGLAKMAGAALKNWEECDECEPGDIQNFIAAALWHCAYELARIADVLEKAHK